MELSHIAKLNEEKAARPFYLKTSRDTRRPVITSVCTTTDRLSSYHGHPRDSTLVDLMRRWVERNKNLIPPRWVDKVLARKTCEEGQGRRSLPVPGAEMVSLDGGRFIGTAHFVVSKDPETGWINLGTYRSQLLAKDKMGTQFIKGKARRYHAQEVSGHGETHARGLVMGCDPLLFVMGAARVSAFVSEYDVAGSIRGRPSRW